MKKGVRKPVQKPKFPSCYVIVNNNGKSEFYFALSGVIAEA